MTNPPATLGDLLCPRSVAVVGASRRPDSIGGAVFKNLLANGFQGPVYPVNPKAEFVQSVRAYPVARRHAGPGRPRGHHRARATACSPRSRTARRKGVRGAGRDHGRVPRDRRRGPRARGRAASQVVRGAGMRMVGPNCLGVLNTDPAVRARRDVRADLAAGRAASRSPRRAARSGSRSSTCARELGLGISTFVVDRQQGRRLGQRPASSTGRRIPTPTSILLYLESFGNPRRFTQIARRVARDQADPRGEVAAAPAPGARAAQSHTGRAGAAPTSRSTRCSARPACIRTDTIEELFDAALLLAHQPLPRGPPRRRS